MASRKYASLHIFKATKEFVVAFMPSVESMRRFYKYSIGGRLSGLAFGMLFDIYGINKEEDKAGLLSGFMDKCEMLRCGIQLCAELRALSVSSAQRFLGMLDGINEQACRWKKYSEEKKKSV